MITANLAGSASSHLRNERNHNYSHSRLNLNNDGDSETASRHKDDPGWDNNGLHSSKETLMQKCSRWYQTWLYLTCVAVILIGAIILIVLLATGIISPNDDDDDEGQRRWQCWVLVLHFWGFRYRVILQNPNLAAVKVQTEIIIECFHQLCTCQIQTCWHFNPSWSWYAVLFCFAAATIKHVRREQSKLLCESLCYFYKCLPILAGIKKFWIERLLLFGQNLFIYASCHKTSSSSFFSSWSLSQFLYVKMWDEY